MRIFQGLLLLAFGVGMLLMVYQSLGRGWLPFGSRGFLKRLELHRQENPVGYWFAFMFYTVVGLALAIFSLRVLAGISPPLKLR